MSPAEIVRATRRAMYDYPDSGGSHRSSKSD
jgi:hypothetical protein